MIRTILSTVSVGVFAACLVFPAGRAGMLSVP
jgi:hypothetical protein